MHQSWTVYVELGGSICRLHSLSLESDQSCLDSHLFRNIIQCSFIAHDHNYVGVVWMLATPRLSIVIWLMKHVTWHPNYCPILNFSTRQPKIRRIQIPYYQKFYNYMYRITRGYTVLPAYGVSRMASFCTKPVAFQSLLG